LLYVVCAIIIHVSSDGARTAHRRQQRNIADLSVTLRPPRRLDGSPQNGTPAGYMCPFREDIPISVAGGGVSPLPVLTIGLLVLFWVWILDETMLPARLRRATFEKAAGQKGTCRCRCRVCTLRIQARGQPLHDVRDVA